MLNVAYKTTRQWNPGDEFILKGCQRIMTQTFGPHNAVIYNCNPDVRPMEQVKGLRNFRLKDNYTQQQDIAIADSYFRIGFNDNSIKFDSDLSYVDYAVFAGTPEIISHRVCNFYEHIINYQLPCFVLGAGYWGNLDTNQQNVLKQAKVLTFRSAKLAQQARQDGFPAKYLPCPALLSSPTEKQIKRVETIGLVWATPAKDTVPFAGVNAETFAYLNTLYTYLIKNLQPHYQLRLICHYVDELAVAHHFATPLGVPVCYSYDAQDYFSIYQKCDLVISPRVHGCGIAASLGIPGLALAHDQRADTCKGFLSDFIFPSTEKSLVLDMIGETCKNIQQKNKALIEHKKNTWQEYISLMQNADTQRPQYAAFSDVYLQNRTLESSLQKLLRPWIRQKKS